MFVFSCAVVLAASLQVISSQGPHDDIPMECRRPPPGVTRPMECCKIPQFFDTEFLKECGFKKLEDGEEPQPRPPGPPPPPDCSKQLCLMEKYGLAKDGEMDIEAVSAFLVDFGQKNEKFEPAVKVAKEKCIDTELGGPPHICKANKMMFCIHAVMFTECPTFENTDDCKVLKEHMEQCKPYFDKKP